MLSAWLLMLILMSKQSLQKTKGSAVTDEKELSFSRTPFSKRPIGKTDNVEESVQKKQTLHVVATMHPGSPGADHPPPAL